MTIRSFALAIFASTSLAAISSPGQAHEKAVDPVLEGPATQADCNKPVYFFSLLKVTDREKLAAYISAMTEAGLRVKNGGRYVNSGTPIEVLEGEWTDQHSMFLIEFPCEAAARNYWFSDVYQNEIRPLREGAGDLLAALFELNDG